MEKMKKIIIYTVLLTVLLTFYICGIKNVHADSGFDTSYDSGSSSSSDFSSSDYSSSSSGSGNTVFTISYDEDPEGFIIFTILVGIISLSPFVFTIILIKFTTKNIINHKPKKYLSDETITEYIKNYNKEEFNSERFKDFVEIQNAWMEFDLETLRKKLTDELYNQYEMQLDTLKAKNEQNIMHDFKFKDLYITDIKEENDNIILTLEMTTSFYDYIVGQGQIVRGNKKAKLHVNYEMIFICAKEPKYDTCPNCGAKINNKSSQKCEYCNSSITAIGKDWVLAKKEVLSQWIKKV